MVVAVDAVPRVNPQDRSKNVDHRIVNPLNEVNSDPRRALPSVDRLMQALEQVGGALPLWALVRSSVLEIVIIATTCMAGNDGMVGQ